MPSYFDNKVVFLKVGEDLNISVTVHVQPSVTGIYLDGNNLFQKPGNINEVLKNLKNGQRLRIHTSIQDKNDNTDDIKMLHQINYNGKSINRTLNATASEEGEIFDVFTDVLIMVS